ALARKFCKAEAGPKSSSGGGWRIWEHVIAVRLGDEPINLSHFEASMDNYFVPADLWKGLLRAWLGADFFHGSTSARRPSATEDARRKEEIQRIEAHLRILGFEWLIGQLHAAEKVYNGGEPPAFFFIQGAQEAWRGVLASLQALAGAAREADAGEASRILWMIAMDKKGGIESIVPMEQKRSARGWGRSKPMALSTLAKSTKLNAWDAKVARALRQDRFAARSYIVDRALAIIALIGHPAVTLSDAPDVTIDLVEGTPELEVVRQGESYVLKITPEVRDAPMQTDDYGGYYYLDDDSKKEIEALRYITLQRDSPQRVRVIRLTSEQRRAAQLVSGRFAVPVSAQDQLQQTLQTLSAHFQIQSDHIAAAREVVAESGLRAELAPVGESLLLRLVVAPLGIDGPRLMPGNGRARVMAALNGESVGTVRDLKVEQAGLDEVLAAFEFLDPPARGDVVCEWQIDDPEEALGLVEALPKLPSIQAVDWPRGKPVRVITVDSAQMVLQVRTERDWFKLQGKATLDEGLVMNLEELLAASAGKTRFVPMGKGVYAALTRELRDKLAELRAVGESKADGLQVPQLAAALLDEVLQGVDGDTDAAFTAKVECLRAVQDVRPIVPAGLQAELRAYQEEGFVWAMRLAQAGFGAILADDMGLGKTVQTLGVLLARALGGPALVIAPTSVCGNWLAETQRFAPTLNVMIYGEGERAGIVEAAGPGDLVVVSYTLMQQAGELFASKTWHTLVADEAQAVKNATARRTLALFELPADFRMALSGTPIENRLGELWSIMRFCNPGLLGSATRFTEKFATPIERDRDREAQRMLRRLIAPFVLRRTKSQVLDDLPPRTELVLSVALDAAEAAHYEALRRVAVSVAEEVMEGGQAGQAHLHILAQLTRLRRAACDPRLVSPELGIVGAKVRAFAELVLELAANGHKALVFSQFVDFLTLLRVPLEENGIKYQYLDGSTPAAERTKRVAAFQAGEGDLFLISLKAGGFGLNLTAADYVVITDPWWNPAAEDQAMGRAHRIGQRRPVTVYRLIAKGTLEEKIVELHHEKRALAEGLLADGGEAAVIPSTAELIELMRN
ncbi:MAG: DEAD/DEAH box helicase, partial [Burkholderiales bacterium]